MASGATPGQCAGLPPRLRGQPVETEIAGNSRRDEKEKGRPDDAGGMAGVPDGPVQAAL